MTPTLPGALRDWETHAFPETLRSELLALGKEGIPLHKGTRQGGYVDDADLEISLLRYQDRESIIEVRIGLFFTEIVVNCGCGVDPMPVNAYCEMRVCIDKKTAEADFCPLDD